ncbi:hypothetical protein OSTOST_00220 [Ostertagia ostertagi]
MVNKKTEELLKRWRDAANLLAKNPEAKIICPECNDGYLEKDYYVKDYKLDGDAPKQFIKRYSTEYLQLVTELSSRENEERVFNMISREFKDFFISERKTDDDVEIQLPQDQEAKFILMADDIHIRIPGLKQPAIQEILKREKIDSGNDIELLKRFGQKTISNPYELMVKDSEAALKKIDDRAWEIKKELVSRIKHQLRRVPEIRYFIDDTLDNVFKMEELFKKINKEKKEE